MSYYKYKPRDPQVQVNWTEAASNLTAVIQDEVTLRKELPSSSFSLRKSACASEVF